MEECREETTEEQIGTGVSVQVSGSTHHSTLDTRNPEEGDRKLWKTYSLGLGTISLVGSMGR